MDDGKNLLKIQVKFTSFKAKSGVFQVSLKSCGGTRGTTYKTIVETDIDFLFIVTSNKDMYEIPIEEIKNKSTINLGENHKVFKKHI